MAGTEGPDGTEGTQDAEQPTRFHAGQPTCAEEGMKYTYKDITTGRTRFTRGVFVGWQTGGLLNVKHAEFHTQRGCLFVPEYCLTPETKKQLQAIDRQSACLTVTYRPPLEIVCMDCQQKVVPPHICTARD
jgi:hypothetical protein